MMLPISTIHENPANARHVEASLEANDKLISSMRTVGLLQPVVVMPHGIEWMLLVGHRRLRAARHLGWDEIFAVELPEMADGSTPEEAISAAENMVRQSMHPIDQWRAIRNLQEKSGYSLETAAAALGISRSLAQRMNVLAALAPEVLAELAKQPELPAGTALRTVSAAPVEMQQAALARASRERDGTVRWFEVANGCTIKRIPMKRAIFDTKQIPWDEDFFAEPNDEDRFTTKDVEAFMEAQQAALTAQIAKQKGRYIQAEVDESGSGRVKLPRGWDQDYNSVPKRFAKDDPRKVFATIVAQGNYRVGCVDYAMAAPREVDEDVPFDPTLGPGKPAINKATLTRLAEMKAAAVQARMQQFKGNGAIDMLRAMLMLFTLNNVVAGKFKGSPYNDIAVRLVLPDGQPAEDVVEEDLCDMAAWVISRAIEFDHPKSFNGPGKGAEWLAIAVGADMPRTDTKEILRGVSVEKLQEAAQEQGINALRDPSALRKAMVGKMPFWRIVDFGAPGPIAQSNDDDDEIEEQDAAE